MTEKPTTTNKPAPATPAPTATTLSPIATIEAEITALNVRRTELFARGQQAEAKRNAARSARVAALIADSNADITSHTRAVQDAEGELEIVGDLSDETLKQIAAAETRLAAAQDEAQRDVVARQIEAAGAVVAAATADMAAVLVALGEKFSVLVAAIPPVSFVTVPAFVEDLGLNRLRMKPHDGPASPLDLARAILAEGLAAAVPGSLVAEYGSYGEHAYALRRLHNLGGKLLGQVDNLDARPVDVAEAARLIVTDRLAARAAGIRSGLFDPSSAQPARTAKPVQANEQPAPTHVEIVAREDFWLRPYAEDEMHKLEQYATGVYTPDVAQLAITTGLAFRTGSTAAAEMMAERQAGKRRPRGGGWGILRNADGTLIANADVTAPKVTVTGGGQRKAA